MVNIDRLCAEIGFSMIKDNIDSSKQENAIRRSMAILSQDGIFAYFIYLESEGGNIVWDQRRNRQSSLKDEEKVHRLIMFYSVKLLNSLNKLDIRDNLFTPENERILLEGQNNRDNPDQIWDMLRNTIRQELTKDESILENIHQMFFVKRVLEQMLTYALYRARSLSW